MSKQSGIILPGDLTPEARQALTGKKPMPAELREAAKEAERRELVDQFENVMGTAIEPYKDDAPRCDAMAELQANAVETDHNGIIQAPAWAHGQCIGQACNRFTHTKLGPICGRKLQDLHAGKQLGLIDRQAIEAEFALWSYNKRPVAAEAPA